jgi:serine/threonine protein kinase
MAMDSVHDQRAGAGEIQGCDDVSISLPADETFVEDTIPPITNRIKIKDWSQTGRGSHVDFGDKVTIPIRQGKYASRTCTASVILIQTRSGRFLGRGAMSDVHETTIKGYTIAHKRTLFRRRIGRKDRKEVEILKRLSHVHIVQLVDTYAQGKCLGILLYPVAVCDLHTFFEDVEAWSRALAAEGQDSLMAGRNSLDSDVESRLKALHYEFPQSCTDGWASIVYSRIGCLVSAIDYLHDQKIRHKDLKPSNILLSPDQLWLTDFGSSTDFSQLSQSATDNERGTPRYFAPE